MDSKVDQEHQIAVYVDLDNIAIGVKEAKISKLDISVILDRLVEKGKITVKKAYADWTTWGQYKRPFHECAVELIDIPRRKMSGKNSADIKMVVDALELSYTKSHVDTFALISGDSDFSPLVSQLRENNKKIIGIGVKHSSSNLLIDNCDEFIFYEDLVRTPKKRSKKTTKKVTRKLNKEQQAAFSLLISSIAALQRENYEVIWGSMVKQTMKRKQPTFSEEYHGYTHFSRLLEDAEKNKLIKVHKDQRSGTYIIDELLEHEV